MTNENNFQINLKVNAKFGEGEALRLGQYLKEMKLNKIGILLDSAIADLTYIKEIIENVKKEDFEYLQIWNYDLKGEPDYDSLDRIKLLFLDENQKPKIDCFVGIGGGSVIDFAKGLATLMTNSGPALNFRGFPENLNPSLPVIALPTTAGTGSEVTFNAVFINLGEKKKLGINTRNNFPALAILDPVLTLSCPKTVTVSSGIDALVHCIEGYLALGSTSFARFFAKEGFNLMFNNLRKAIENPGDIKVRQNLQLGAYFGGLTLLGSGGGPTGALSYTLGVRFRVPHGLAGGVFLPYIVKHNVDKGYDFSELHDLIEGSNKIVSKEEKNITFAEKMFELWEKLGVTKNLTDFGVTKENTGEMINDINNYEKAFQQNPTPFTVEEGKQLVLNLIT